MIKLVATDLDGTLLHTDKTISVFTQTILADCRKKGVRVVYATGRGGSAEQCAPAHLFDGRIIMNGAVGYINETVVYSRLIPMGWVRDLLAACDRRGLKAAAEISGMHYSNFNVTEEWSTITNYQLTDFCRHDVDAEKLYAIVQTNEDVAFIQKHIPHGLYLTVSRDNLAQIMHAEATKSNAIAALAANWGITTDEIVTFGDDLNDIDMLSCFGYSVAMANAVPAAKNAAKDTCEANDDDGVAKWLLHNVLD